MPSFLPISPHGIGSLNASHQTLKYFTKTYGSIFSNISSGIPIIIYPIIIRNMVPIIGPTALLTMVENIKQSVATIHITKIARENENAIRTHAWDSSNINIPLLMTIKSPVPNTKLPIPKLQNAQKMSSVAV